MKFLPIVLFWTSISSLCAEESDRKLFEEQLSRGWQIAFTDDCRGKWQDQWFLDGIRAKVVNSDEGMTIDAAKGYAVLWTQREFEGDQKIEYDFQRVDNRDHGVNILYIQARGKGTLGYDLDIRKWSEKRELAAMKNYFDNMDTYHISYAAFPTSKTPLPKDYIRGRRYMPRKKKGLSGTELEGSAMDTGMFNSGQWLHVTVVKREKELLVEYKGEEKPLLCRLVNSNKPGIVVGRIGLRLMPGRESLFKNFSVSTAENGSSVRE